MYDDKSLHHSAGNWMGEGMNLHRLLSQKFKDCYRIGSYKLHISNCFQFKIKPCRYTLSYKFYLI